MWKRNLGVGFILTKKYEHKSFYIIYQIEKGFNEHLGNDI